jgi:hypothetical protein
MDAALVEADAPAKARARGLAEGLASRKRRSSRGRIARTATAAVLLGLGVALMIWRGKDKPAAAPQPAVSALSAVFYARDDLAPLLYVKSLDGGQATADYRAEIRDSDAARRDTLTLGDPASKGAFLIASARLSGSAPVQPMFFVEMARLSAGIGLAVAHASPATAETRLGDGLIVSDVTLQGGDGDRACVGFRFNADAKADLAGLACGETARPSDRSALECLISRLRATPDGAALGLATILKESARDPSSC